jgi:diguanylate cyclase (GGDEF)-like protein/PAS domain S-box-containing protein
LCGLRAVGATVIETDIAADIDMFELAAVGMIVADRAGRFRRVNPAFGRLLGRRPEELLGVLFNTLISPDDMARSMTVLGELLTKAVDTARFEQRCVRPDGSFVWVDLNIRSLTDAHGEVVGFLTQGVDITDRKHADQAAEHHSRQLEEAQRIAGMGSFEQDPATGVFLASDELCRISGLPALTDVASLMDVIHPDDRAAVGAAIGACVVAGTPADVVHRLLRSDGTVRWVHARAAWIHDEDGRGTVVGTVLDITDLKAAEDALEYQGFHDTLTGLANKALFVDRVGHALQVAERDATPVAVLFVDVDDFKTVNDALGHATGDQLLRAVAKRLVGAARAGDTVARFGGDDFAVLLESGEMPQVAKDMAERVSTVLRPSFQIGDAEVSLRASIGAAIGYPLDDTSDDLLRDADLAMYLAKHNGKDRVEIFRPEMRDEAHRRHATITDLRHALVHGEFDVFYQPIVRVHDTAPAGAEALVRWNHPRRGLTLPVEFVDVAESTGLIVPMGDWVLNQACRQAQVWRRTGVVDDAFYISVNLSARQLAEPTLVDDVARALNDSGLPPGALVLEITESAIIVDFVAALARLRSLKDLGLRLALDDYGTGYSSLNRLGNLPVDIVKIDKSFVDRLCVNGEGVALVRSVIDVTSALGLTSIAEGVELQDQRAALESLGCDCIQGYLFAEPTLPADAERTLLSLRRHRV